MCVYISIAAAKDIVFVSVGFDVSPSAELGNASNLKSVYKLSDELIPYVAETEA